jgi:hypothetical protein
MQIAAGRTRQADMHRFSEIIFPSVAALYQHDGAIVGMSAEVEDLTLCRSKQK